MSCAQEQEQVVQSEGAPAVDKQKQARKSEGAPAARERVFDLTLNAEQIDSVRPKPTPNP